MTSINVENLVLTLQEKINSFIDENEMHYYANAIKQLKSGLVYTVETINDLPNASESEGYLYFVRQDELIYIPRFGSWNPLYEKDFGLIFSWGLNTSGKLGDGTTVAKCSPVREISSSNNWCQISANSFHSSALKITGEIWSWGSGGRLGDGTATNRCSPVREISSSTDWCQVSSGACHSSALKTTGEIWGWGSRLGDGTITNRCSPVREISSSTNWCQVSAGNQHTSAVKTTGEIWSWGTGSSGQLGDGTLSDKCSPVQEISSSTNWCQVSAGGNHTSALKTTGEIWSWGYGGQGRLGNGATTSRCSPVQEISSSTDWCQVSTGEFSHSSAVKITGEIWSWGSGNSGQLGDGTTTNKCSPVREISSSTNWCQVSAFSHSSAIKTTGEIWSWGAGSSGRLGDGTTTNKCSPVREISSSTNWCQVSASSHTSAIKLVSL